jgi:hypothetical protein
MDIKFGIVAVLGAIGPSDYSREQTRQLVRSWPTLVEDPIRKGAPPGLRFDPRKLEIYIYKDTLTFLMEGGFGEVSRADATFLALIIRKFLVDAMAGGVFMRGAMSIGEYDEDREAKTVTGDAVNDAMAWYQKADWTGMVSTPYASVYLEEVMPESDLMVFYDVPLEGGSNQRMKALNWAGVLYIPELTPCKPGDDPRARLIGALQRYKATIGTDERISNTVAFFDHVVREQGLVA